MRKFMLPGFIAGVFFLSGLVCGYFLHGRLSPPLGSRPSEQRALTSDLNLEDAYFFAPDAPPVIGTIRQGSEVIVDWRKSTAAYVSFKTVVPYDRLARVSTKLPER